MDEMIQMRVHGDAGQPTLIYLPGMHGDWTLVSSFRAAIRSRARFVELTYPRTTGWSLDQYAAAVKEALHAQNISHGWLLAESFSSFYPPRVNRERIRGGKETRRSVRVEART